MFPGKALYNFFFTLILFSLIPFNSSKSQSVGTLRGIVTDSLTTEVLPYANVYVQELKSGTHTDNRGYFIFTSMPSKKEYAIIISFVGYITQIKKVYVNEEKITHVNVGLVPTDITMKTVEKIEKRETPADNIQISSQNILIKDLETLPKGVETDIFRSLQLIAGVQSTGDVSARYYVRGGAGNENLILLNDAPIYNPFHALGIFSVIDPEIINNINFYKGGFNSQYSSRLSSVMNIATKDGNKNNFGATAALSELTGKMSVQGPIPYGSFIVTARKTYSNEILKKFLNNRNVPIDFYDASFKLNYSNPDFAPISKFTFFGFTSKDVIDYQDQLRPNFNWSNSIIGANWFHAGDTPLFSEVTLYYCRFVGEELPNLSNVRYKQNDLRDITAKVDFHYVYDSKDELYGGLKITDIDSKLYLANSVGYIKDVGARGSSISLYTGYKLIGIDNLNADFGTRLNLTRLSAGGSYFVEPRINFNYKLVPSINFKAAWGIYQQDLTTVSDENEIISLFEPWIITPEYLKPSSAVHYIGGFDFILSDKTKINVEGYYKLMHNLAVLNEQKFKPDDHDLVDASGKSYGAELTITHNEEPVSIQLSYAYSWSTKTVGYTEYHPRYDSRQAIKFFITYDLGNGWSASAIWDYNSGMPYTQYAGYYDKLYLSNLFDASEFFTSSEPYRLYASRNAARLPDYHRQDLNVSKKLNLFFLKLNIDLNLLNVYNRKNFFYFDANTGERVNMLPFLPTINVRAEL